MNKRPSLPQSIRPHDLQQLGQIIRPSFLLVLLVNMGELPSAYWIAQALNIDPRTAMRNVKDLVNKGYLERIPDENGYRLSENLRDDQKRVMTLFKPDQPRGA